MVYIAAFAVLQSQAVLAREAAAEHAGRFARYTLVGDQRLAEHATHAAEVLSWAAGRWKRAWDTGVTAQDAAAVVPVLQALAAGMNGFVFPGSDRMAPLVDAVLAESPAPGAEADTPGSRNYRVGISGPAATQELLYAGPDPLAAVFTYLVHHRPGHDPGIYVLADTDGHTWPVPPDQLLAAAEELLHDDPPAQPGERPPAAVSARLLREACGAWLARCCEDAVGRLGADAHEGWQTAALQWAAVFRTAPPAAVLQAAGRHRIPMIELPQPDGRETAPEGTLAPSSGSEGPLVLAGAGKDTELTFHPDAVTALVEFLRRDTPDRRVRAFLTQPQDEPNPLPTWLLHDAAEGDAAGPELRWTLTESRITWLARWLATDSPYAPWAQRAEIDADRPTTRWQGAIREWYAAFRTAIPRNVISALLLSDRYRPLLPSDAQALAKRFVRRADPAWRLGSDPYSIEGVPRARLERYWRVLQPYADHPQGAAADLAEAAGVLLDELVERSVPAEVVKAVLRPVIDDAEEDAQIDDDPEPKLDALRAHTRRKADQTARDFLAAVIGHYPPGRAPVPADFYQQVLRMVPRPFARQETGFPDDSFLHDDPLEHWKDDAHAQRWQARHPAAERAVQGLREWSAYFSSGPGDRPEADEGLSTEERARAAAWASYHTVVAHKTYAVYAAMDRLASLPPLSGSSVNGPLAPQGLIEHFHALSCATSAFGSAQRAAAHLTGRAHQLRQRIRETDQDFNDPHSPAGGKHQAHWRQRQQERSAELADVTTATERLMELIQLTDTLRTRPLQAARGQALAPPPRTAGQPHTARPDPGQIHHREATVRQDPGAPGITHR